MFKQKKCVKKILLILAFLFCLVITLKFIFYRDNINNISGVKNENVRRIEFEPYSNQDNLTVMVTIEDTEYGINKIEYKNMNNENIVVNANNKRKVSFDYIINKDGEYKFIAYNQNGEKIEKTLVIDSINDENNTFDKLIDINIMPIIDEGYVQATKANIDIKFNYGFGNNYYKIGNSESWNLYENTVLINSYSIIKNNLQNSDNKTLTIYAKKEDEAHNKIIITKETAELDFDIAVKPNINIITSGEYVTLTSDGPKLETKFNITFDERTDITNYYSIDNGNTWNVYEGEVISNSSFYVYAKSVKNNSGLEIQNYKSISPSASDAFPIKVFDESTSTYIVGSGWDEKNPYYNKKLKYVYLDSSTWGKKLNIRFKSFAGDDWKTTWKILDSDNTTLWTWENTHNFNSTKVITIPENANRFTYRCAIGVYLYYLKITD